MIALVDPAKSAEFKAKNAKAAAEHAEKHKHDDHGHSHDEAVGCCGTVNKYHFSEKEMSSVDRTINAKIKQESFFRENLVKILERTN